jgi:hypothetical protein
MPTRPSLTQVLLAMIVSDVENRGKEFLVFLIVRSERYITNYNYNNNNNMKSSMGVFFFFTFFILLGENYT